MRHMGLIHVENAQGQGNTFDSRLQPDRRMLPTLIRPADSESVSAWSLSDDSPSTWMAQSGLSSIRAGPALSLLEVLMNLIPGLLGNPPQKRSYRSRPRVPLILLLPYQAGSFPIGSITQPTQPILAREFGACKPGRLLTRRRQGQMHCFPSIYIERYINPCSRSKRNQHCPTF